MSDSLQADGFLLVKIIADTVDKVKAFRNNDVVLLTKDNPEASPPAPHPSTLFSLKTLSCY